MNNINLIGRLTAVPELRYSKDGKTSYCNISLAVTRDKDNTDFINCTAFNKVAETLGKYVKKGNLLGVSGSLYQGSYMKDNKNHTYHYVNISRIDLLEKNQNNLSSKNKSNQDNFIIPDDVDNDLPFN